jgi:2-dehydro-3-deoxyphosphogluconate aldolase/(4S)-4-hydroxy-2-oxoglutarate aldolase
MTIDEVIRRIGEIGIVPVVRAATVEDATRAVEASYAGGISIIEITMTIPSAPAVIRHTEVRC